MSLSRRSAGLWVIALLAVIAPLATAQELVVSAEGLFFAFTPGGSPPPSQTLSLSVADEEDEQEELNFVASTTLGTWLRVTPTGGKTPATLTVSVNPTGLAPGTYTDLITLTGGQSAVTVSVQLFVASQTHSLIATPAFLTFTADADSENQQQTKLVNINSALNRVTEVHIESFGGDDWLTVQPTMGPNGSPLQTPLIIEATVDPAAVTAGVYSALIVVMDPDGKPASFVPVTFTVTGSSNAVELDPSELAFSAAVDSTTPQSENVTISSGSTEAVSFTVAASTESGGNWLRVSPTSGTTNSIVAVTVDPRGLAEGTYEGTIKVTAQGDVIESPVTFDIISGPLLVVTPDAFGLYGGEWH